MKKFLLWTVTLMLGVSIVLSFSLYSCKVEEVAEEVAEEEVEEEAEEVEEEAEEITGTLKIWDMEVDNAFSASWEFAREKFKEMYPNVTVEYETKTFEQMQETGKMILASDDVPDVMQSNKGSSTAGVYASEGLLTDLTSEAEERGWTDIMSDSLKVTCRYDDQGIMGSGNLYGVTNYGEFVMVYYNKDMFEQYDIEVPTSYAEFEAVCDKFVEEDIIPIALGGLTGWPIGHVWYELFTYKADRELINNYHFFQGDVDFHGEAFNFAAEKLVEYATKGYFDPNVTGLSYDDANYAFIQGQNPINITGSWWFGSALAEITEFDWGIFTMPGKDLYNGSGGDLWVVPENAKNKELAFEFIDLTMQEDAQTVMANAGGIPINADLSQITDPKVKSLNEEFNSILEKDGLAFYPDWPAPCLYDVSIAYTQELLIGTATPEELNNALSECYNEYKESLK
jgi:raffinose/stachyose/melibiose transport system substrate-binding protein